MELSEIEAVLAEIADELSVVREDECLACYLDRTIPQLGCRDLTLTKRWNDAQPRKVPRLVRWLKTRGGFCDCEVVFNVLFTEARSATHQRLRCEKAFAAHQREGEEEVW